MHALILGATGATGKDLLDLLLKDPAFQQVSVFVRRKIESQHPKLLSYVIDFDSPNQWKHLVAGDVLFSCLGTTLKAAGSIEAQRKVDYEYQYHFAKAARENNVRHYVLVSAENASPTSMFPYAKMKADLEEAVTTLGFPRVSIFRPPLLLRKDSDRAMEVFGGKAIKFLNALGMLRSQRPLPTEVLAKAMIHSAKTKEDGVRVISGQAILQWAHPTQ